MELKIFELDEIMERLMENGVQTFNNPGGNHDLEVILIEWGIYSKFLYKSDNGFEVKFN